MSRPLLLGAVAYDPKVVTIWAGFRAWFRELGFDLDFVLYAHYERQVADLVDGQIEVAWNSPLAWVRARRLAAARGQSVAAVAMRDTDRDLRSVIVVRRDDPIASISDLQGRVVGTGAIDSPQATLLPLSMLRQANLVPGRDFTLRRHDIGVGLHGDHIGGERDAAVGLLRGDVDAACMTDSNLLLFAQEGTLPSGSTRVLANTEPYDHCTMAAGLPVDEPRLRRFVEMLLAMSYADDSVRSLLDLEGLKRWLPGRLDGYPPLERAVDETSFYSEQGKINVDDYRP